jgi:hypothetical protein
LFSYVNFNQRTEETLVVVRNFALVDSSILNFIIHNFKLLGRWVNEGTRECVCAMKIDSDIHESRRKLIKYLLNREMLKIIFLFPLGYSRLDCLSVTLCHSFCLSSPPPPLLASKLHIHRLTNLYVYWVDPQPGCWQAFTNFASEIFT